MASGTEAAIGEAIRALRKRHQMNQATLAKLLGLQHAQSVSAIENGDRHLRASELATIAEVFRVSPIDLLKGTGDQAQHHVLWREAKENDKKAHEEATFLKRCERFAFLESLSGLEPNPKLPQLQLDIEGSEYGDIETMADNARSLLGLGDTPAHKLREILESKWRLKLFFSHLESGSGATTRGRYGDAVVENVSEPPSRRTYSLGHELFHLLTWNSVVMRTGGLSGQLLVRNEKFANAFSSCLLMPKDTVIAQIEGRRMERLADLLPVATSLKVSFPALLWRLVNLKRIERDKVQRFLDQGDLWWGSASEPWDPTQDREKTLPVRYALLAFAAYVNTRISIGKLAEVMETTVGMLKPTLRTYDIDIDSDVYQTAILPA